MKLSSGERLILVMLSEVYKHLKMSGEIDPGRLGGNTAGFSTTLRAIHRSSKKRVKSWTCIGCLPRRLTHSRRKNRSE